LIYDSTASSYNQFTLIVEQGALSARVRDVVEVMLDTHVGAHGNDPQQSLAAVSSASSIRQELKQTADPDLHASLVHVSKPQAESNPAGEDDPHATVGTPSSAGLRFRIVRPHAHGGLGEVFVAHGQELHREIALKQIRAKYADDGEARSRFLLEAEITGGLEHPGIVPVYGLGQYADGRPFYAMRFIKGDSLKDAIERFHNPKPQGESSNPAGPGDLLALRKLLGRFIDVCEAIQYAHDRGVLHRDLKPGNIMLGKYGETLVVDWGLAKAGVKSQEVGISSEREPSAMGDEAPLLPASASSSSETLPGSAIGTPSFMSPEQAAGRLDQLGPASDICCLGATLCTLLSILDSDQQEIAKRISSSAIKEQLVAALDHWAGVAFRSDTSDLAERLLETTRSADPDPSWGDRLRQLEAWKDQRALITLAPMPQEAASLHNRFRWSLCC
jgi:serine/threonine protein kinase